jgi:nucleoside-diphosphate-sugar epimerase
MKESTMDPILLAGGSGLVGQWVARHLRAAHPDVPLLIGGRDQVKAQTLAIRLGAAEAVELNSDTEGLGLGDRPVAAIATLYRDEHLTALRLAQSQEVGHISISAGPHEIAPEVAAFM